MSLGYRKNIRETLISSSGGSLNTRNKISQKYTLYKGISEINKKVCSVATVNTYMNKIEIQLSQTVGYMSEASHILKSHLPFKGKYILDKSLTGCGGTEFFINSGRPLVLVSPRTGVLVNKKQQHPECHLFRDMSNADLQALKESLRLYFDKHSGIFGQCANPVIFVTLDSAKYVIEELKFRGIIDNFLFLTDEFQCLISDAAFKGNVDLEFLKMLDAEAKNICYMSATPIDETYLCALPEFQNVDYYKLKWHPSVIVEPTIKEVMMKKGESASTIMKGVIDDYRRTGYFARKIVNGSILEAKEVVVFVNEVKTILKIITDNKLKPDETTILISQSNKYAGELKRRGYSIDNQPTDRNNPRNTTYTYCSKASFEGRDFYSTSAFTYIFIDGSKDWQVHDTTIEIPQMLGRQRLDENPFKYNAIIYCRTKPSMQSRTEYMTTITDKLNSSKTIIDNYNNSNDSLRKSLVSLVRGQDPNNRYQNNYLEVIDDASGGYSLQTNLLVAAAEHNLAVNKANFYSNPLFLTTAIHNQMATYNAKPQELRDFEKKFNSAMSFQEKMQLYCRFRASYPGFEPVLMSNPFIEPNYHAYYNRFGPETLNKLGYDEATIEWELCRNEISTQCRLRFQRGREYSAAEVKTILQTIYNDLSLDKTATVAQLPDYIAVEMIQRTLHDGSRPRLYLIK